VSAVTKSGTNSPHGALFEFVRNSDFDAKSFFDSQSAPIPPLQAEQFGAEADGPILRNRTFFSRELRRHSPAARRNVRFGRAGCERQARHHPRTAGNRSQSRRFPGYLALIPLPNGRPFGDGTGQYSTAASQATNETFFAGTLDHRLSDATTAFARFTYDAAISALPDSFNLSSANSQSLYHYLTIGTTHTFNEHQLDTFRFSANRSYSASTVSFLRPVDPSLSFLPGDLLGQISVTGFFSLGRAASARRSRLSTCISFRMISHTPPAALGEDRRGFPHLLAAHHSAPISVRVFISSARLSIS
jgi:hypothetical protein